MIPEQELDFRRRWYQAHLDLWKNDQLVERDWDAEEADFRSSADDVMPILARLRQSADLDEFRTSLQVWSDLPTPIPFNEFKGQLFVNQLAAADGDPAVLAQLLADGAQLPLDDQDATYKINRLVEYVDEVRTGANPSPGGVLTILPYFWAMQDPTAWPVFALSGVRFLETTQGWAPPQELADRYLLFRDQVAALDQSAWNFGGLARWWAETGPLILDPVLCARCEWGEESYDDLNAQALVGFGRYVSTELSGAVAAALGRSVHPKKPLLKWTSTAGCAATYADWGIQDNGGLGLRLWVNPKGVAIGARVGKTKADWYAEVEAVIAQHPVDGYELMAAGSSKTGKDFGFSGGMAGEYLYGRWFPKASLNQVSLEDEVVRSAAELQPLLEYLDAASKGGVPEDFATENDPLAGLVKEFEETTGYPESADLTHKADREHFAAVLQRDVLLTIDPGDLRRIYNSNRYGSPGPQSVLNVTLRDADAAGYDNILETLTHLLWGEGDDADRLESLLEGERKIHGLGESVMMKLLAIAHPDRYVPIFPYGGPMGKRRMLTLLDLPEPTGSRGQVQVESSRAIYRRLNRFFPTDPWGMNRFCYWLSHRESEPTVQNDDLESRLADMAENELVPPAFLAEMVELLQEKGQIILYGPPGTGKTYLARKLAEALAPDPARRKLVQFHPSTSYEDFFEGFRPEAGANGEIAYRLTPGPLALMAEESRKAPGARHVMVIDEINRANLPKVFGELLFLLEYRGEAVTTLYRPDDPFELPKDLLFIGTMNTADRSIALIDAALRRRFHFIPFFPHDGAMSNLLEEWLTKHEEPAWVNGLVAMVNAELTKKLGGPHLQVGPSYFMTPGLNEDRVRRVWEYNIEPFIEDQLFGDPQQIAFFKFDKVLARYKKQSAQDTLSELPADSGEAPIQ